MSLHSYPIKVRVRLWTLTWAEEGSGRPTEHFQLTISGRVPRLSRFCLGGRDTLLYAPLPLARSESNGRQCECVNTHNIRL